MAQNNCGAALRVLVVHIDYRLHTDLSAAAADSSGGVCMHEIYYPRSDDTTDENDFAVLSPFSYGSIKRVK